MSKEAVIQDYSAEIARLARQAEWWGASPQGRNVALYMECLADEDIIGAMETRDDILTELRLAKSSYRSSFSRVACWAVGVAVFAVFTGGFFYLIVDPMISATNTAVSSGIDALAKRF